MQTYLIRLWVLTLCCTAIGGSLTPPGPPAPSMKTLADVEPRTAIRAADLPLTIVLPGSYYLAENITVSAADPVTTAAIIIQSDNVTIDLNGFTLAGSLVSDVSGIVATGPMNHIVVRNGCVCEWEEEGIRLEVNSAIVEDVTATEVHGTAIVLTTGQLINCIVRNNVSGVLFTTPVSPVGFGASSIRDCIVQANGETGIIARRPVHILNTTSSHNNGNGISLQGSGSVVSNCVMNENRKSGLSVSDTGTNCRITDNTCVSNEESGILVVSRGCRIERNHLAANDIYGLKINQRSLVLKNTAYDNTTANYDMVGEVIAGPIVTTTGSDGTISSDHPWANLSFHSTRIGN